MGPPWDQGPHAEKSQTPCYQDFQLTREASFSSEGAARGSQQHLRPGSDAWVSNLEVPSTVVTMGKN